jgi:hypothetical protein
MVVGDGVGLETLPGRYDTPVQEAGIAWPPCVTNTNKKLRCVAALIFFFCISVYLPAES